MDVLGVANTGATSLAKISADFSFCCPFFKLSCRNCSLASTGKSCSGFFCLPVEIVSTVLVCLVGGSFSLTCAVVALGVLCCSSDVSLSAGGPSYCCCSPKMEGLSSFWFPYSCKYCFSSSFSSCILSLSLSLIPSPKWFSLANVALDDLLFTSFTLTVLPPIAFPSMSLIALTAALGLVKVTKP